MTEKFFPKVAIIGGGLKFNTEAIETMELDTPGASIIIIENQFPEKPKTPKELIMIKTNGSLCDEPDTIKDVFDPKKVRKVMIEKKDDEIIGGAIALDDTALADIVKTMGEDKEFKLLLCNTESPLAKEFREQFDMKGSYYKLASISDKRSCIGKEKNVRTSEEERVSV